MDTAPKTTKANDVSRQDLEERLQELIKQADEKNIPEEYGFFGPDSMTWKIGQESIIFMGSAYALWMQEAHPWVSTGADEHSKVRTDPFGRWKRTFKAVNAMIIGDRKTALKYARMIHNIHSKVHGTLDDGTEYAANNNAALLWVGAVLVYTSIMMYEYGVRDLTYKEKDDHYQEFKNFLYLFGVSPETIPETWNDFLTYYEKTINDGTLQVKPHAKELVTFFLSVTRYFPTWAQLPFDTALAWSAGLLPPNIRLQYGLSFGMKERILFDAVRLVLKKTYTKIPFVIRKNPYYRKVLKKTSGAKK